MALEAIVEYKHRFINEKIEEIKSYKDFLLPSANNFFQALEQSPVAYICEIKQASPSLGLIRKDVNVLDVAKLYSPFADAISVLADEKYFLGSLENVLSVSHKKYAPLLCKDIVVSPWQIYQARRYGADAVLLMLSVLDDDNYRACEKIACDLKMAVVCEVHDEEEMKRANQLKAKIIGINNRNLKTLEVDVNTTERLLNLAWKDALIISESGFATHRQIYRYKDKVKGFLVGTSLMRQERIDRALRELIFGRVKICGLTNAYDAKIAYDNGAYYGGLNFSPLSQRCISVDEARSIIDGSPLSYGGIFVNQSVDEVISIARKLKLDYVQLHGDEEKDYIAQLRPDLPADCAIWQAIRIKDQINVEPNLNVDLYVFDTHHESSYGGTGKSFDWSILKNIKTPFALAGGINPDNVNRAESIFPLVIDVASGVEEKDPRKKSLQKIKKLFSNLRNSKEFYER